MPERHNVRTGLLLAFFGGVMFTFDLPLLRMAGVDHWTLVFFRGLLPSISVLAVWVLMNRGWGARLPILASGASLAVIAVNALANISLIGATTSTATANVVLILALVPVLTAIFSRVFIREPVSLVTWAATIFALEGVGIIVWDSTKSGNPMGDLMALVCACCSAAAFTIIRHSKQNMAMSLALGSLVSAGIAAALFPINASGLLHPAALGAPGWLWMLLNGLLVVPLGTALIANAPRFIASADVSMFFLLETLLAPLWVWLVFHETPSWGVFVGGSVVVLTLLAHSFWRFRSTVQRTPPRQRPPRRVTRKISS